MSENLAEPFYLNFFRLDDGTFDCPNLNDIQTKVRKRAKGYENESANVVSQNLCCEES